MKDDQKVKIVQSSSLLLTAPRRLHWVSEDLPTLRPDEVLVQTTAGAISVGAELPQFRGLARNSRPMQYPHMTGYESVGTIVERGSAVERLRVGERVVAFYGHRTHAVVRSSKAIPVPDDIPDPLALPVILTCDAAKGIRKLMPLVGEPILVTGAGAVGLFAIFILKALGMQAIDVIEPSAERHDLALQLGARRVDTPTIAASSDHTYAIGIECSSHNAAFALLQASMAHGGRICMLSDGNLESLVLTSAFHEKELTVVGSSDGWDYQEHARWYFRLLCEQPAYGNTLAKIFNHHTTATRLIHTFDDLASGAITATKVLVQYETVAENNSEPG